MNPSLISFFRLANQQLSSPEFTSPRAIVSWMCAMQAQDFPMAKWGIGVRLPGSTDKMVETAIDKGEILRTHLLRPTWHFVAAEDIRWLIELTAPQIKSSQRARDRDLELTEAVYSRSNATIENALSSRGHLTRDELMTELHNVGIATDQNRASHLFMRAELDGIICSGTIRRGKPSYALLDERVPNGKILAKEEALAELARRYFTSRSPATLQDFTWWSGLTAGDAKLALELIKSGFVSEMIEGRPHLLKPDFTLPQTEEHSAHLLPTYDEYVISYADRSAAITPELEGHMKDISDRGIFWPIILLNGRVAGTWKRTVMKDQLLLELEYFSIPDNVLVHLIEKAIDRFGIFSDKKIEAIQQS